jgi:hypothetical protein
MSLLPRKVPVNCCFDEVDIVYGSSGKLCNHTEIQFMWLSYVYGRTMAVYEYCNRIEQEVKRRDRDGWSLVCLGAAVQSSML